jgi:DNA-binding beta-propeller fold protein YncE
MKYILFFLLFLVGVQSPVFAQTANIEFTRIKIGDAKHMISGLALSPDLETLAISPTQSFPFYLFDWKTEKVLKEFNVGNWYAGSAINFSAKGKYIVLNQLKYLDFSLNKDREVNFEVVDASSGKRVKRFEAVHAVAITPDEKYVLTLSGEEVSFWNLSTGKKEKSFKVNQASNGIAISPDGKLIAVSHKLYEKDAKQITTLKRDKKTLKHALKYKQQISVFDATSFKELYTINELYDIIYKLTFSKDGNTLICLNIPHTKAQSSPSGRQTYVNVIDMNTHQPERRGFVSTANYEPDFKLSHDEKLFGIISRSNQFLELHIYDFESKKLLYRFQQSYRLFEKNEGGMIVADSRATFVFLPGDESVLMTMGNHLIKWNFKPKN